MAPGSSLSIAGGAALAIGVWYIFRCIRRSLNKGSVKNKVVLLTGASSGLGEACAHVFYRAGAKLILASRRRNELERVKRTLMELNVSGSYEPKVLELDLSDLNLMALRVEEAMSHFGQIDILINNGGVSYRGEVEMTDLDVDQRVMNVNYFGQVALTKAVLPFMIGKKTGHIVAVGSIQGKLATPYRSTYTASKHAMQAFFDCLRAEVSDHNINVTVVNPSYIKTNLSLNAVTGDGTVYGELDQTTASGMKSEYVAEEILNSVLYKNDELTLAPLVHKIAIVIRCLWPFLYFKLMNSRARKQRKDIQKTR